MAFSPEQKRARRAAQRQPKPEQLCTICGKPFEPRRTTARYCSDTCRSIARHDRVALGARLTAEHGLSPLAAKVVELSMVDRDPGQGRPTDPAEQIGTRIGWLIRLVHERQRWGSFRVSGQPYRALADWLDDHPEADLAGAERELRALYRKVIGFPFRLPQREETGARGYLPPQLSEHAWSVLHAPARRAAHHRGEEQGDCAVVALATVTGLSWLEARRLYGDKTRSAATMGEIFVGLGCGVELEHLDRKDRQPLRTAGQRWPEGRHLLHTRSRRTGSHVAALVDGRVDDWAAESGEQVVMVTHIRHG